MKRSINQTVLVCSLIFSLFFGENIFAQKIEKTYSKSLAVPKGATYEIINAQALDYEMHATMSSTHSEEGYILRPGVLGEMPCFIIRNYRVATWDKDSIKQVVNITVTPDKNRLKDADDLVANLKINIPKKEGNLYLIDGNINLKKMELINGFFRKDRNTFILDSGQKFDVRQLIIESILYIPKQSNILLRTDYVGLFLEDLEGKLSINAKHGYLQADNIKEVEGNIRNFNADFKSVDKMTLNSSYSSISATSINQLVIGSLELFAERKKAVGLFEKKQNNTTLSFSNKYRIERVDHLKIRESGNDEFNLGTIKNFSGINASFSNFHIKKIEKSFEISGKNGDVTIYDVATNFEKISISNQISTVELNMQAVENFKVNLVSEKKTELKLNSSLQRGIPKEGWAINYFKGKKSIGGIIEFDCEYCEIIIN